MKNVIYVLCILGFIFFKVGCEKHHTPCAECENRINVLILPQEAKVEDFLNLIRKQVENGIGSFFIKNEKTVTSLHYFSCDTWQPGWRGKMAGDFNEYSFYGRAPEDVDLFKITFYSSNRVVAGGKNCSPI